MKQIYQRFTSQSFKLIAVVMLAMNDLISTGLLYFNASDKEAFAKSWADVEKSGALKIIDGDSAGLAAQVHTLFMQSVILTCALLVVFHWGIYAAYYYEKKLAYTYLKIATWFMALGSLYTAVSMIGSGNLLGAIFLPVTFDYLFVAMGLRYFPVASLMRKQEQ